MPKTVESQLHEYGRQLDSNRVTVQPDQIQIRLATVPALGRSPGFVFAASLVVVLLAGLAFALLVNTEPVEPVDTVAVPPTEVEVTPTTSQNVSPTTVAGTLPEVDLGALLSDIAIATSGRFQIENATESIEEFNFEFAEPYWSSPIDELPDQTWAEGGPQGNALVGGLLPLPETRISNVNVWLSTFGTVSDSQAHFEALTSSPEAFGIPEWGCFPLYEPAGTPPSFRFECERGADSSAELDWSVSPSDVAADSATVIVPTWQYERDGQVGTIDGNPLVAIRQSQTVAVVVVEIPHDSPIDNRLDEATYLAEVIATLLENDPASARSIVQPDTPPFSEVQQAAVSAVRNWTQLLAEGEFAEAAATAKTRDFSEDLAGDLTAAFQPLNQAGIDYQPSYCQPTGSDGDDIPGEDYSYTDVIAVECLPRSVSLPDGTTWGIRLGWQPETNDIILLVLWTSGP